jgi:hypothetical protein
VSSRTRTYLRQHALGLIAIFIALSATAVALPGKNTVNSGDIKKGNVKASDLAQNAVSSQSVSDNSLTGADVDESTLQGFEGPKGDTGATGPAGPQGDPGATGPPGPSHAFSVSGAGTAAGGGNFTQALSLQAGAYAFTAEATAANTGIDREVTCTLMRDGAVVIDSSEGELPSGEETNVALASAATLPAPVTVTLNCTAGSAAGSTFPDMDILAIRVDAVN